MRGLKNLHPMARNHTQNPTVPVLLSASVERFSVSGILDFYKVFGEPYQHFLKVCREGFHGLTVELVGKTTRCLLEAAVLSS